jgi:hypothetical protein
MLKIENDKYDLKSKFKRLSSVGSTKEDKLANI